MEERPIENRVAGSGGEGLGLLTVREVAQVLRVGVYHVYALLEDGELEKIALGPRRTRVTRRSLEAYIERMRDKR